MSALRSTGCGFYGGHRRAVMVGARRAAEGPVRALRDLTLARARSFVAIPYDELVAEDWPTC
ncbi:MAG: hypothetical protein WKF31_11755 [Thermoleophilaceae bacterium]